MHDLLSLTGRDGAQLHLLAVIEAGDELIAEGSIVDHQLRAGRVFTTPNGSKWRLTRGLTPGVQWTQPVTLERR